MPVYCFICPFCDDTLEVVRSIGDRERATECRCGGRMVRDINAENVHSTDLPYQKTIYSDAMAVDPGQVAEFRKENPNLTVLKDGRVAVESHSDHKRVMKQLGFHDRNGYN
jgi:putative FmdB family regulatory protein